MSQLNLQPVHLIKNVIAFDASSFNARAKSKYTYITEGTCVLFVVIPILVCCHFALSIGEGVFNGGSQQVSLFVCGGRRKKRTLTDLKLRSQARDSWPAPSLSFHPEEFPSISSTEKRNILTPDIVKIIENLNLFQQRESNIINNYVFFILREGQQQRNIVQQNLHEMHAKWRVNFQLSFRRWT